MLPRAASSTNRTLANKGIRVHPDFWVGMLLRFNSGASTFFHYGGKRSAAFQSTFLKGTDLFGRWPHNPDAISGARRRRRSGNRAARES